MKIKKKIEVRVKERNRILSGVYQELVAQPLAFMMAMLCQDTKNSAKGTKHISNITSTLQSLPKES